VIVYITGGCDGVRHAGGLEEREAYGKAEVRKTSVESSKRECGDIERLCGGVISNTRLDVRPGRMVCER
jgi:hypothetical protein